jgi:P pilus assembly chaperone PapD
VTLLRSTLESGSTPSLRRAFRVSGWLLGVGGLSALATPSTAQIAVDRMEIVFQPKTADPRVGVINLKNEGTKPVQAQVRLEDWDRAEDGTNHWFPQGTLAGSCGQLLRIFPASVSLDPGASQAVRVTMDTTAAPAKECWSAAVVETVQPRIASGRAVNYVIRTAVKLYVLPPDLRIEGEVNAMRADRDSLDLGFANTGERHLVAKGSVEFRRPDNSVAARVELPVLYTLPGASSRARIRAPKLSAGRYVVLAILDYGGDQLAAAQIEYEVPQ